MVITRIVEWDDVLAHKQAWNVLVWFATLVTMADGLNKVGFHPRTASFGNARDRFRLYNRAPGEAPARIDDHYGQSWTHWLAAPAAGKRG